MSDKTYIWQSEKSTSSCEECKSLAGKVFANKDDAPSPPLHPNCKCKLVEVERISLLEIKENVSSSHATEEDTLAVKKALIGMGLYNIPSYGLTPYADKAMFDGIKQFQKENNLFPTGEIRRGDETHRLFNEKQKRKKTPDTNDEKRIVSPVANPKIRKDADGDGAFGAPRGARKHNGVDLEIDSNAPVKAPVSGVVERIGKPYSFEQLRNKNNDYYLIVIKDECGYKHELFYVDPWVRSGDRVKAGEVIGKSQSLEKQYPKNNYPNMKNHIHLQVRDNKNQIMNPRTFYKGIIPGL